MRTSMKHLKVSMLGMGLLGLLGFGLCVADELPFKEGTVTQVSSIRVKEGHFIDYWTFLSTSWRQEMEEAKKQGIVVSYAVYEAYPKTPQEPNLYLVVEYPSLSMLDGIDDKMAAIDKKVWGSLKQADQSDAERESIRTVLGGELIRELHFKP